MNSVFISRKGSSTVEAAIIFPMIILVVLVVITITIWFYEEEVALVSLHINLWAQAQQASETGKDKKALNMYAPTDPYGKAVFYLEKDTYKSLGLPFMSIKGVVWANHERKGFFPYVSQRDLKGQIYIINEMDYIRCYDLMMNEE